jgi:hypothetical protein
MKVAVSALPTYSGEDSNLLNLLLYCADCTSQTLLYSLLYFVSLQNARFAIHSLRYILRWLQFPKCFGSLIYPYINTSSVLLLYSFGITKFIQSYHTIGSLVKGPTYKGVLISP